MSEHAYYPVALNLKNRKCLIVGGGRVAEEKIDPLVRSGANVTVISPDVRQVFVEHEAAGRLRIERREYETGDVDPYYLVIAATDSFAANAIVADEAKAKGIIVNAVDDPPRCDFFAVSIIRRDNLQVAISTNGRSPAFARWMREWLETEVDEELGQLLEILGEVRDVLKRNGKIPTYPYWKSALESCAANRSTLGDRESIHAEILQQLTRPDALASAPAPWRES